MIRDIEHETLPREALEAMQLKRLQTVVERVYHLVPFYRRRMDELAVKPGHIRSLADLKLLPFTTKQDLRDNYPFGMFAVPMEQIVRIHACSGTTGKPTPVAYTRRDLETWSELMARTLAAAGTHPGDIVHNAYGYGLFTGGLGFHYGAERLGAAVIPVSGGQTRRQIMLLQDFGPTVLCLHPVLRPLPGGGGPGDGGRFRQTKLRVGIFGAEPWTEGMRHRNRKAPQPGRRGHLRPLRNHGPRRQRRVPGSQGGAAPGRGPLPAGNHQPRHPGRDAPRRPWANW